MAKKKVRKLSRPTKIKTPAKPKAPLEAKAPKWALTKMFGSWGTPKNGPKGTGHGKALPCSLCVDKHAGTLYYNSKAKASPHWKPIVVSY